MSRLEACVGVTLVCVAALLIGIASPDILGIAAGFIIGQIILAWMSS